MCAAELLSFYDLHLLSLLFFLLFHISLFIHFSAFERGIIFNFRSHLERTSIWAYLVFFIPFKIVKMIGLRSIFIAFLLLVYTLYWWFFTLPCKIIVLSQVVNLVHWFQFACILLYWIALNNLFAREGTMVCFYSWIVISYCRCRLGRIFSFINFVSQLSHEVFLKLFVSVHASYHRILK